MAHSVEVEKALQLPGLRLVLTAGVPGPWGEAAKAILHVKRLPFVRVRQEGGGENRALFEWTGQASAPVAAWNDEPPRTGSLEILFLAERLAPDPSLVPDDAAERALVLGTCREIVGELGLGWCRRLMMFDALAAQLPAGAEPPAGIARMLGRYGYSRDAARRAPERIAGILRMLGARLERQHAAGSRFLFADRLSAADLYWAAFAAMFEPLPHELCPMPATLRRTYTIADPTVRAALDPRLLEHRDFVYREFLELPMDF